MLWTAIDRRSSLVAVREFKAAVSYADAYLLRSTVQDAVPCWLVCRCACRLYDTIPSETVSTHGGNVAFQGMNGISCFKLLPRIASAYFSSPELAVHGSYILFRLVDW